MKTSTALKESPILFSGPMVRAILDGRKTMTRRVVKPQPRWDGKVWHFGEEMFFFDEEMKNHLFHEFYGAKGTPYGSVYEHGGDRLWVRETWLQLYRDHHHERGPKDKLIELNGRPKRNAIEYRADCSGSEESERCRKELGYKWRPSIFMPRWASRITLEITDVRVERLQEITEADAEAEGLEPTRPLYGDCGGYAHEGHKDAFIQLWEQLNAKRGYGWDQNPWVWCVSFRRID